MNIPDLSALRVRLQKEIENLQDGKSSINQAKAMSNLANAVISSVMAEIAAVKSLPDNQSKVISYDYIDVEQG